MRVAAGGVRRVACCMHMCTGAVTIRYYTITTSRGAPNIATCTQLLGMPVLTPWWPNSKSSHSGSSRVDVAHLRTCACLRLLQPRLPSSQHHRLTTPDVQSTCIRTPSPGASCSVQRECCSAASPVASLGQRHQLLGSSQWMSMLLLCSGHAQLAKGRLAGDAEACPPDRTGGHLQ